MTTDPRCWNDIQADNARLRAVNAKLVEALKDMQAGWRYVRDHHGDLYGVGWDRCEKKANVALAAAEGDA